MKKQLKIGGVPEHFNFIWKIILEKQLLADQDFTIDWTDVHSGTGAMLEMIEKEELDLAVLLTEGAIAGITKGLDAKILGTYTDSPLTWGIFVHQDSDFQAIDELQKATFGISRYYSGSHLMSFVNARQRGWDTEQLKFNLVGTLTGAQTAMAAGEIDAFMWEQFTTKFLVDQGHWRMIDTCKTPWPCFVLLAKTETAQTYKKEFLILMETMRHAHEIMDEAATISYIGEKFNLQEADVKTWYAQTSWLCEPQLAKTAIELALDYLLKVGIIQEAKELETYLADWCSLQIAENTLTPSKQES